MQSRFTSIRGMLWHRIYLILVQKLYKTKMMTKRQWQFIWTKIIKTGQCSTWLPFIHTRSSWKMIKLPSYLISFGKESLLMSAMDVPRIIANLQSCLQQQWKNYPWKRLACGIFCNGTTNTKYKKNISQNSISSEGLLWL